MFKRIELDSSTTNKKWFNGIIYKVLADDKVRNQAYKKAIKKYIDSNSKVLEIGCGDRAYLSLLCLEQKPKSFTAIEENEKAYNKARKKLFRHVDKEVSIELIKGNSNQVKVSNKANVLVHEIIGSIASAEGVAQAVTDAKSRFMETSGKFIPEICRTWMVPVSKPKMNVFERLLAIITVGNFKKKTLYRIFNFPKSSLLEKEQLLEELEFAKKIHLQNHRKLCFRIKERTLFSGLLFYLEVNFDEENMLNSLTQITNWSTPYLNLYPKGIKLEKGDTIEVEVQTNLRGLNPIYGIKVLVNGKQNKDVIEFSWQGA